MTYEHEFGIDELIEAFDDHSKQYMESQKNNPNVESFNLPLALKTFAKEIKELKEYIGYLHEIIPQKYKKFNPQKDENPFFSKNDIFPENMSEEYQKAKERMRENKEKYEQFMKFIRPMPDDEFRKETDHSFKPSIEEEDQ